MDVQESIVSSQKLRGPKTTKVQQNCNHSCFGWRSKELWHLRDNYQFPVILFLHINFKTK